MATKDDLIQSVMDNFVAKLALATQTSAGRMSAPDKKKLDELPTRAELDKMLEFESVNIDFNSEF